MAAIEAALLVTALAVTLGLFVAARRRRSSIKLPPSPPGLPLLGNLLMFGFLFRDPSRIRALESEYGPIFTLYLGFIPTVIVTGRQMAHEALSEQGAVFASRPQAVSRMLRALNNSNRSVNTAAYGPYWRTVRRNLPLAAVKMQRFSAVRRTAVDRLVSDLGHSTAATVTVRPFLRFTLFTILSYMCFGCWLEDEDIRRLDELMREIMRLTSGLASSRLDMLPLIAGVPIPSWASKAEAVALDYSRRRREFLEPKIQQARRRYDAGELDPGSYLYALFELQKQGGTEVSVSDEDILVLAAEFLNAGADTTAVTLEWALACLVKHPSVQQKLFEEVQVAASGGEVNESTAQELKYLQAVVKETLRLHPPGFSTLPHTVTQPCKLGGYDIPMNTRIFFYTYSMSNDPEVWDGPGEYKPERFLTGPTELMSFVPFGAGRRICPGIGLAELHMHYILARLVQAFEWRAKPGEEIDMSKLFEFTILMKNPLAVVISSRNA